MSTALVVTPNGSKVCLVLHAKLGRWLQPGGHAEAADGGVMERTALREAREETGCEVVLHPTAPRPFDVDVHVIPARKDTPAHQHLDVREGVLAAQLERIGDQAGRRRLTENRVADRFFFAKRPQIRAIRDHR